MKADLKLLSVAEIDGVIRMAWEDRRSFEEIHKKTGLREADVIRLMRRELKPASFRVWRARVSGRSTKHRKRHKTREFHPPTDEA